MATRKSPAERGTPITSAQIEAAERAQIVAAALKAQQGGPPPLTPEAEAFVRTMSVLDRQPTADERAAQEHQARLDAIAARNAKYDQERREYAARLKASGYKGWIE